MNKMKKVRNKFLSVCIILMCSSIINILTLGISKTYSWFNDNKVVKVAANVAQVSDIIQSVVIVYPTTSANPAFTSSPAKLVITKAKGCKSDPMIYFNITGRLQHYVQHINPIELNETNKKYIKDDMYVYEVPIYIKVNVDESNYFIKSNKARTDIDGNIDVMYLNSYFTVKIYAKYSADQLYYDTNDYSTDPDVRIRQY